MTRTWRTLLLAALVGSISCSERLAEHDPDPDALRRRCSPIHAFIEEPGEARIRVLPSDDEGALTDWWCTCVADSEVDTEFRAWVNEMGHLACLEFVEREGYDNTHSTCQEDYEKGLWGAVFGIDEVTGNDDAPYCDVDEPVGCGVE